MSSQVNSRDLLINMICIEKGIVPFLGVDISHISTTLCNMSEDSRRIAIRKFRKILKKAIRYEAATWCATGSEQYLKRVDQLRLFTGLGKGARGPGAKKISVKQSTLRHTLVARYLTAITEMNS